jgi:hypothetical protein
VAERFSADVMTDGYERLARAEIGARTPMRIVPRPTPRTDRAPSKAR